MAAVEGGIESAARGGLQASWAQREGRTVAGRRPKSPPLGRGERGDGVVWSKLQGQREHRCWRRWGLLILVLRSTSPFKKKLFWVFGCAGSAVLSAGFL